MSEPQPTPLKTAAGARCGSAADLLLRVFARQELAEGNLDRARHLLPQVEDWDKLVEIAGAHGVEGFLWAGLQSLKKVGTAAPLGAQQALTAAVTKQQSGKLYRWKRVLELIDYLEWQGLRVMVIKGTALDLLVYDRPWLTSSLDVDVVTDMSKQEIGTERLTEIFAMVVSQLPFVELEFNEHHDVDLNHTLRFDFSMFWDRAEATEWEGRRVFVMAPEDLLITAAISSSRRRFLQLKRACDIRELVLRNSTLLPATAIERASQLRSLPTLLWALGVADLCLGLPDMWKLQNLPAPDGWKRSLFERLIANCGYLNLIPNAANIYRHRHFHWSVMPPLILNPGAHFRYIRKSITPSVL